MSKWRQMSTAPRDGTVILLGDNRYSEPAYLMASWDKHSRHWATETMRNGSFQWWADATHWMPLPKLPEPQK